MTPNAKESGAVAWRVRTRLFRDVECAAIYAEKWEAVSVPLVHQSALHAAEAELGELRRRVGELLASWDAAVGDFTETSAKATQKADPIESGIFKAAAASVTGCATELRQLLASDGGAGGA